MEKINCVVEWCCREYSGDATEAKRLGWEQAWTISPGVNEQERIRTFSWLCPGHIAPPNAQDTIY